MKVLCIDSKGFNLIKVGVEYELVKETRDFYFIINGAGIEKRYGKSCFQLVDSKKTEKKIVEEVKEVPKKEAPKKECVICIFPKDDIFTYNGKYYPEGKTKDGSKYIFTIAGNRYEILTSRFKSE